MLAVHRRSGFSGKTQDSEKSYKEKLIWIQNVLRVRASKDVMILFVRCAKGDFNGEYLILLILNHPETNSTK